MATMYENLCGNCVGWVEMSEFFYLFLRFHFVFQKAVLFRTLGNYMYYLCNYKRWKLFINYLS
jgi:hypothetical protein